MEPSRICLRDLHERALEAMCGPASLYDDRLRRFCGARSLQDSLGGDIFGYYAYLRAFTLVLRPRTVLELGTCQGGSALFMLLSLPEDGRLVTVDIERNGGEYLGPCLEDPRLELVQANTLDPGLAGRLGIVGVDLLFVDTEHTYEQASREWGIYGKLLNPGGMAAFDDIHLNPGMERFWDELPEPKLDTGRSLHYSGFGLLAHA